MKTFKDLLSEIYSYPPTTPDEKKFIDIHTIKMFDYPVKNSDGLPFKDEKIKQPGTQHKKPASYDPPKEPTDVYKKVNDLNKRIKYKVDEEVEQVDERTLLPKTIHVTPGGYGTHYVLDMAHDVDVEHPSNPGTKLSPGDKVSEKDMNDLMSKGHEVKVVNEEKSEDDAVSDYFKKGGTVKKLKPRVAKGISYMRNMSRTKGTSPGAKMQYRSSKTFSEVMSYINERKNNRNEDVEWVEEKKLTPAEMKKREEVAKAIERENPSMPKPMKMAIATKTAKRVAEELNLDELLGIDPSQINEEGIFEYNDVLSLLAIASDNDSEIELFFEDSEESLLLDKDVCDLILSTYSELDEESQAKFEYALQESHKGFMYCVDFANTLQEELANENN